ncbi:response regulator transcription factor [Cryobacterium sp. TMT1-21]|uniref:Response regulator transcription factor n=1 Tax=Cryobacterium shii TaxID=1259235 RepID=A0AAQ2HGV3_9MICO|nr:MULTISPECIES: response regulator transcription factor [Cryobacterium]TFC52579.1 response regulator transcription factor [Cryobacterium shii]TFC82360.1 response regulator transcription factor [Cryobacterium sp. TmT2-59]TFD13927.1 response regulator transcription factor [Cryobacterium sp. TMT4-10]TFD16362.1 response regulator transcription factor [Cryobacterium sp. TMT1-21]TFD27952.1 response regulator transcription factor [Cryobacterium sp. TMT2-23]
MTRVFLVDDHEIVRHGLVHLINAEADLEVVGEASTRREALARVAATRPDVAVLDVRLPDGSGIDVCREILARDPGIRCLIFTAFDDDEATCAAVLAGAAGYVLKNIRGDRLIDGIRRVARGERLLTDLAARRVAEVLSLAEPDRAAQALTLRERQVLDLISRGLTNRQIGAELELAEKTVKNYVSAVLSKLGMQRRTQAAVFGADLSRAAGGSGSRIHPGSAGTLAR